jgi:hypothetical protein
MTSRLISPDQRVFNVLATLWQRQGGRLEPEAGISKNHCATNSGSPQVELMFCPWLIEKLAKGQL